MRNIGPDLKFRQMSFPLPGEKDLGLAYDARAAFGRPLLTTLELGLPDDDAPQVGFGVEYVIVDTLALRLGYRTGADMGLGLRFGFGLHRGPFSFDYTVTPYGDLGTSQIFSVSVALGGFKK